MPVRVAEAWVLVTDGVTLRRVGDTHGDGSGRPSRAVRLCAGRQAPRGWVRSRHSSPVHAVHQPATRPPAVHQAVVSVAEHRLKDPPGTYQALLVIWANRRRGVAMIPVLPPVPRSNHPRALAGSPHRRPQWVGARLSLLSAPSPKLGIGGGVGQLGVAQGAGDVAVTQPFAHCRDADAAVDQLGRV